MGRNKPKARVAYILSMAKRGIPAFTYREIEVLTEEGVEVSIFPLKFRPGPYMPKPEWYCAPYTPVMALLRQPLHFLKRPRKYLQLLLLAVRTRTLAELVIAMDYAPKMRARGVERVHCHFGDRKLFVGYYVNRLLGLPLSVTVHAYEIYRNPSPRMFKLAIDACDHVVVQSEYNAERLVEDLGVPKEKIRIIRAHGDLYDPEQEKAFKLLIVAEFREKKGYDVLFEALKSLERDDWVLWVVGEGKLDVPAMAKQAGIKQKVHFFGMLPGDLLDILYSACDLFVLPSKTTADGDREGIPAVLMEAMSHAKPVISTRHAGIPELVEQVLVDENDVKGLSCGIEQLIADPGLRQEMGLQNREIVRKKYSRANVEELERLFTKRMRREVDSTRDCADEAEGMSVQTRGDCISD